MTYSFRCRRCGHIFEAKRPHAVYCSDRCRWKDWEENGEDVELRAGQRVAGGVGSRGGNVRSVEDARRLQETYKAEWTTRVKIRMAESLLRTGYFHADDLADLEIPAVHANIAGGQTGGFRTSGYMVPTGEERKVAHAAANARKGKVFRITAKGREQLPGKLRELRTELDQLTGSDAEGSTRKASCGVGPVESGVAPSQSQGSQPTGPGGVGIVGHGTEEGGKARSFSDSSGVVSGEPGADYIGAVDVGQSEGERDQGRPLSTSPSAGIDPPDLLQLDEPRRKTHSMYDAWEGEAA